MISKERLKELIEQGKDIYSIDMKNYVSHNKFITLYGINNYFSFNNKNQAKLFVEDSSWWHWFNLEDLFETEEEAEWEIEFGNIERTERLYLPTWEEFSEDNVYVNFNDKYSNSYEMTIDKFHNISLEKFPVGVEIFCKPLTKETYIESCRLCKKLFLNKE